MNDFDIYKSNNYHIDNELKLKYIMYICREHSYIIIGRSIVAI